ncbi:MAG: hypothetical protein JRG84_20940 [Deltaproteobacteria bacterium]|nr:hypothetical protein [Deltaproteobacteria bacterium]
MLVLALLLFTVSVLMCGIALWIAKRSDSIQFDFSANDLVGELRGMTYTLAGWLVLALLGQGGSLLILSIMLPVMWVFS